MSIEEVIARAFQLLVAMTGAYVVALWFALVVWTFRDIESRSRSVIAQIFSTLVVVRLATARDQPKPLSR